MARTRDPKADGPDTTPRGSEACPQCGSVLTVSQDGWKVCHACSHSGPGGSLAPVVRTLTPQVPLTELESDPWAVDTEGQSLMCRMWARERGIAIDDHVTCTNAPSDQPMVWGTPQGEPLRFLVASRRILARVMADPDDFLALCWRRGARVEFVDMREPAYSAGKKKALHRAHSLPTHGAPLKLWGDDLYERDS